MLSLQFLSECVFWYFLCKDGIQPRKPRHWLFDSLRISPRILVSRFALPILWRKTSNTIHSKHHWNQDALNHIQYHGQMKWAVEEIMFFCRPHWKIRCTVPKCQVNMKLLLVTKHSEFRCYFDNVVPHNMATMSHEKI